MSNDSTSNSGPSVLGTLAALGISGSIGLPAVSRALLPSIADEMADRTTGERAMHGAIMGTGRAAGGLGGAIAGYQLAKALSPASIAEPAGYLGGFAGLLAGAPLGRLLATRLSDGAAWEQRRNKDRALEALLAQYEHDAKEPLPKADLQPA